MRVRAVVMTALAVIMGISLIGCNSSDEVEKQSVQQTSNTNTTAQDTNIDIIIADVELNTEVETEQSALENTSESTSGNTPESDSAPAEEVIIMANGEDPFISEQETETEEKVEQEEVVDNSVVEQQSTEQQQEKVEQAPAYEVEAVNKTMYATSSVNLRKGPSTDYGKVGSLSYAKKVTITGVVHSYKGEPCLWYHLSSGEFVSGNYLSDTKPQQTTTTNKDNNSNNNKKEENNSKQENNNKTENNSNKNEESNNKKEESNNTKKDSPFKVDPDKCGDIEYGGGGKGAEGGGSAYNDVTFN